MLNLELATTRICAIVALVCGAGAMLLPGLSSQTRIALPLLAVIVAAFYGTVALALQQQRGTIRRIQWFTTTFEASLPAAILIILATIESAQTAAGIPAIALYVVAFLVVGLRHLPILVVFATLLGGAQYILVYRFVLAPDFPQAPIAAPVGTLAWIFFLGGLLAVTSLRSGSLARTVWEQYIRSKRLERELSRHVSHDVAEAILRNDAAEYRPEKREVSVLFCDLRGFTFLCERERPEDVVSLLNAVFDGACSIIEAHGGTVNKFLGDGLLALFGAPQEHPNHAYAAAQSAIEIQRMLRELRRRGGIWTHLAIGIGIDTGEVVAGPLGAHNRVEYTAIGSPVNRAARLQGLAERERERIIISSESASRLGAEMQTRSLGEVELKGFARSDTVFALGH
jgi:adenylate cyclase